MKYIVIDHEVNVSIICDTQKEVIEYCGYDVHEITFEPLLEDIKGIYEVIEIEGDIKCLNSVEEDELIMVLDDIDGETMENVIREVGMEDQMLRQLIMTMPLNQIEELIFERKELDCQN
jgi:hypothetical protein